MLLDRFVEAFVGQLFAGLLRGGGAMALGDHQLGRFAWAEAVEFHLTGELFQHLLATGVDFGLSVGDGDLFTEGTGIVDSGLHGGLAAINFPHHVTVGGTGGEKRARSLWR